MDSVKILANLGKLDKKILEPAMGLMFLIASILMFVEADKVHKGEKADRHSMYWILNGIAITFLIASLHPLAKGAQTYLAK
jgi:hypothetical protein